MHRAPPASRLVSPTLAIAIAGCAAALFAACNNDAASTTSLGAACSTDDDCDPGDNCIDGACQGDSAGPDGGVADVGDAGDAGASDGGEDAGPSDGGSLDGGHETDGGSQDGGAGGVLTLAPLQSTITAQAGVAPAAIALTIGNSGVAALHWAASCSNGAKPSPSSAALAAGANATLTISLPTWITGGAQTVACTVSASDASNSPRIWTLSASVSGAPASVGSTGGTVDLLDFSFTADTRPANCDNASGGSGPYPQAAFESALSEMLALSPQFGFDIGDHMYVCSGSLAHAQADMKLYTDAIGAKWSKTVPFFMTMGNHECEESDCSGSNKSDPNYTAYLAALTKISDQSLPYYTLQIKTRLGRATFLFIADHYFDSKANTWLMSALEDADSNSAYTFIIKHYPVTGARLGPAAIDSLISAHHYSLILTAHDHLYAHDTTTAPWNGRSLICGLGGASSETGNQGFCRVQQTVDGTLQFTQYGLTGNPGDGWSVTARQ